MLSDVIEKAVSKNSRGVAERVGRVKDLLGCILAQVPGNLVEIGLGHGQSVVHLIEHAWNYQRKVLGVDPWGCAEMEEYNYHDFQRGLDACFQDRPDLNCFTLLRKSSQSAVAKQTILSLKPIAFAFVDGDMSISGVLGDLNMLALADAKVICVDDYHGGRWPEVAKAVKLFASTTAKYKHIEGDVHETYLLSEEVA
jgi:hypothetical protein